MDTNSFVIYIETEDFYKDIADDVKEWFGTYNLDENDKSKNKKVPGFFKNQIRRKNCGRILCT